MWLLAILSFINNLLIATFTLMWFHLFMWLQTLFYTILALCNTMVTLVWAGIKVPFVKLGTFLYKLGSTLLGITQLTLLIVNYSIIL